MKLKILTFILFITCLSCSKDDPKVNECSTEGVIDNCFKIDENYFIGSTGYVPIIFKKPNNEIILFNSDDNSLMAFDENLNMIWHKTYNLSIVHDVMQNESGEILLISTEYDEFSEVTKLADDGSALWKVKIENDSIPLYKSITRTHEKDGYIISGTLRSADYENLPIVSKIDEYGTIQWSKVINEDFHQRIHDILEVQGGYLIFGSNAIQTQNGHAFHYYVLDNSGDISERKTVGNIFNYCNSLNTPDDGILTASSSFGSFTAGSYDHDYQLIKVDAQEEIVWTKLYGGKLREEPASIIPSKNGGYYICGSSASYGFGHHDIFLIKLDDSGNVLWQNIFGTSERDFGGAMVQLDNSDLVIVGNTGNTNPTKIFLMKLDENGTPK